MTHQITITNESTEKCINLKYSEGNAIKIVPIQFGTIDGEQTYTMRNENEITFFSKM